MAVTFTTTIFQAEGKNATGIRIPEEKVLALGKGKKPAVVVSINGYQYRSTVAVYGTDYLLPVSQEHRAAAKVQAGDEVEVTLELDTEPRTVEVPEDLQSALSAKEGALAAFEKAAPSQKKEMVRQVNEAKSQETRERRIANIVAKLGGA